MIVGILKEIKAEENHVGVTPARVKALKQNGHRVLVEQSAGQCSGFTDDAYNNAGAEIIAERQEIFAQADMVIHVKNPQPSEYEMIRPGQIVFTFLHLAVDQR